MVTIQTTINERGDGSWEGTLLQVGPAGSIPAASVEGGTFIEVADLLNAGVADMLRERQHRA